VDQCEREPERANAINAQAVGTLAEHCRASQTRLVHFGTDFIFDGRAVRPYRPDDPPNPLGAYGRSKLLGETELRRINPPGWLILRLAWLYGENGACFPQTILNVARQGKPLRVVDDQIGSPTYTRDVAEIAVALVERNASGIFHAVNSGMASWFEFTRAILDEFAVAADLSPQTSAQWKASHSDAAERPAYSVLDISATERVLGRPIRSWREALHEYRMNALPPPTPAP
jgi:dTDP-4-dehydrorhamnose reductase